VRKLLDTLYDAAAYAAAFFMVGVLAMVLASVVGRMAGFNLRGSDADYIIQLADYVDGKMRAVAEATSTVDTMRLAVLAALNIADEYHILKRQLDNGPTDYLKRAHRLSNVLDEVLEDGHRTRS